MTDRTERTAFFRDLGWGIFTHYIEEEPETAGNLRSRWKPYKTWDDRVNAFNTDTYAKTLHDVGAHYAFFTIMQGTQYLCAPNETYDRITGYKPGEACCHRDLIWDLIHSLEKYNIPLFLYYTGDGPYKDAKKAGPAMGWWDRDHEDVNETFVKNWTSVLREYAVRYGSHVKGWWVDGMFPHFGYNEHLISYYREAILAGNPDAIMSFSNGLTQPNVNDPAVQKYLTPGMTDMEKMILLEGIADQDPAVFKAMANRPGKTFRYSEHNDFTAGEDDDFVELPPEGGMVEGSRWHTLAFLGQYVSYTPIWGGCGWNCLGSRHSGAYIADYVHTCNARGGVVSIDCYLFDDGSFDEAQMDVIRHIEA